MDRPTRLTRTALAQVALVVLVFAARALVKRHALSALLRATARLDRCVALRPKPLRRAALARAERAARRASRLVGASCLPRALALRWWLRWAYGQDCALVIGVKGLDDGFIGHAWLLVAQGGDAPPVTLLAEPGEDHGTPIHEARLLAGD